MGILYKEPPPCFLIAGTWIKGVGLECAAVFGYLIYLDKYFSNNGELELYYSQICDDLQLSRRKVAKHIKTLLDSGSISRRRVIDRDKSILLYKIGGGA